MENKVTDNTINHKCSMCGGCCGFIIPITETELRRIRNYVKENNIQCEPQIDRATNTFDSRCCFLDRKTLKCKINNVKPFVCKDFKCDHKDWKQRRDLYDKRAKYNSLLNKNTIVASFTDLVYNDYEPIITYLMDSYLNSLEKQGLKPDTDTLIPYLERCGQEQLLKYMKFYGEDDRVIDGETLL
jgi:Fe-S-cluster containining protein